MPVRSEIVAEAQLTIHKVTGELSFEDALATFKVAHGSGAPTVNVLWDFSSGSLSKLTIAQVRMLSEYLIQRANGRKGGKTAGVMPKDVDFGLARMFENFCDAGGYPAAIGIFRTMDEALDWIHENGENRK